MIFIAAECGKPWLQTTIAYLDKVDIEWLAAIACCLYASVGTLTIGAVRAQTIKFIPQEHKTHVYGNLQIVIIIICWLLVVGVLSVPSLLYAASASIPPDENTLGLGTDTLLLSHNGAGVLLFLITSYAVPFLAEKLMKVVNGGAKDPKISLHLITIARLMIALVVPFVAVLLLNQDCNAQWLKLWQPCNDPEKFQILSCDDNVVDQDASDYCWYADPTLVASHSDICSPEYQSSRCPRAVVDALGTLILQKLIFAVFVAPPVALVISTPWSIKVREFVMRKVKCQPEYVADKKIDQELMAVNMLMDYPLVLGFAVPVLIPLTCLAMAQTAAVTHWGRELGVEFTSMARPSSAYLWICGCLGLTLNAWFFWACGLYGKEVVVAVSLPVVLFTAFCSAPQC